MIAPLVLVLAFSALLQFFVSYCRSVIAACTGLELSEQVREISGIESRRVRSDEFARLLQLLRLCPEPGNDQFGIGAVHGYYGLLGLLRAMVQGLAPALASWAEFERQGCAYFAAVALDRRIAYSRDLMAQQLANRL